MVRDLVHDRVADDLSLAAWGCGHSFDGSAKDADSIGQIRLLRAARGQRHSFIETEKRPASRDLPGRRLVLDHDLQITDAVVELRRELV